MKPRFTLLSFASLLLVGSLAGAATSDPAGATAAAPPANPAVGTVPAQAAPFCAASLLKSPLPALNPAPTPTTGLPCGVCSDRYCQGSTVNSVCFYLGVGGYKQAKCELLLGDMCPQDNKWDCTCSNQPPP
jgi:hypothetical protein